jgi:hypothetical protein
MRWPMNEISRSNLAGLAPARNVANRESKGGELNKPWAQTGLQKWIDILPWIFLPIIPSIKLQGGISGYLTKKGFAFRGLAKLALTSLLRILRRTYGRS